MGTGRSLSASEQGVYIFVERSLGEYLRTERANYVRLVGPDERPRPGEEHRPRSRPA